ncbi:hypothetical protein C8R44DRAFT_90946 [Mycena epipterygia]|nr:hypothetical protein C8R44DRAFT_90946 [Mycena epipterygia]
MPTPPNPEDCVLVCSIHYRLTFSVTSENIPEGYLFLSPLRNFQSDNGTWIRHPEWPAYWSLNPSGSQRLTPEEAFRLGFPSLMLEVYVTGKSWHETVYAALNRFHTGKGFDVDSQDISRHLGHPLYALSCSSNIDVAHSPEVSPEGRQRFKFIMIGALGIIMVLLVSWLSNYSTVEMNHL